LKRVQKHCLPSTQKLKIKETDITLPNFELDWNELLGVPDDLTDE